MGFKHEDTKAHGDKGSAEEWNKDHIIDGDVDFRQFQALQFVAENRTDYPLAPVAGQIIFRTDTATLEVWDGTAWQSAAGLPWYFYDEFEGVVIDVAKWTETNAGTGAGAEGSGIVSLSTGNVINSWEQIISILTSTIENVGGIEMTVRFRYSLADITALMRLRLYTDANHWIGFYLNNGSDYTQWYAQSKNGALPADVCQTTAWTISEDVWHVMTISANENTVTLDIDGEKKTCVAHIPTTSALNYLFYLKTFAANDDHSLDIDYVRVRHNTG